MPSQRWILRQTLSENQRSGCVQAKLISVGAMLTDIRRLAEDNQILMTSPRSKEASAVKEKGYDGIRCWFGDVKGERDVLDGLWSRGQIRGGGFL